MQPKNAAENRCPAPRDANYTPTVSSDNTSANIFFSGPDERTDVVCRAASGHLYGHLFRPAPRRAGAPSPETLNREGSE